MGAVNYAVGVSGSEYVAPNGDTYKLTGWTYEAIGRHEAWIEKRCEEALLKMNLPKEERAEAFKRLAVDIGGNFICSYQSGKWDASLDSPIGFAHWFYELAKPNHPQLTLAKVFEMAEEDSKGMGDAMKNANPRFRATAETPKTENVEPACS